MNFSKFNFDCLIKKGYSDLREAAITIAGNHMTKEVENILNILEADCMQLEQLCNTNEKHSNNVAKGGISHYHFKGRSEAYDIAKKHIQRTIDAIRKEYK